MDIVELNKNTRRDGPKAAPLVTSICPTLLTYEISLHPSHNPAKQRFIFH